MREADVKFVGTASKPRPKMESVQVMRALAALLVCSKHILHEVLTFAPSSTVANLEDLPWTTGVDLFFVISGFIMMSTSAKAFGKPGAPMTFFERRLIRIVPPYWFFTTLIVVATLVVPSQLNTAVFDPAHVVMSYFFIPHFNPGDRTLLQPILGLGWTLVYEMFFYAAFACCLFLPQKKGLSALLALFVALFATAQMGIWPAALNAFWGDSVMFDFLLGVLVYKIVERDWITGRASWAIMAVAAVIMAVAALAGVFRSMQLFFGGMPALILFMLLWRLPPSKTSRILFGLMILGDASYSLYLGHPFVLTIMRIIFKFLHVDRLGISAATIIYYVTTMAAAIIAAVLFYFWVEKPMTVYLQKLFALRSSKWKRPAH